MAIGTTELIENELSQHLLSVGATQVAFPTPRGGVQPREIHVQAPTTNSLSVVVGRTGVQANFSQGGWEFPPGANFLLPFNDYKELFAIASGAGQKLLVNYVWGAN